MDGFDRLELSTETLRELSSDEMGQVAGGVADQQSLIPTCVCTGYYPSINAPCPSLRDCIYIRETLLCS